MIETAAQAYTLLFWPAIIAGALLSVWRADAALFRCVAVLFLGQAAMDIYGAFVDYSTQPWLLLILINATSVRLLTIKPTGLMINAMAGVFLAATIFSVIQGMIALSAVSDIYIAADMLFWQSQVLIAVSTLVVLLGGAIGDGGKCIIRGIRGGFAYVAHAALHRGAS